MNCQPSYLRFFLMTKTFAKRLLNLFFFGFSSSFFSLSASSAAGSFLLLPLGAALNREDLYKTLSRDSLVRRERLLRCDPRDILLKLLLLEIPLSLDFYPGTFNPNFLSMKIDPPSYEVLSIIE